MKGISAVIATILLLLVTISIMGFVYIYLSGTVTTLGAKTEEEIKAEAAKYSKGIWFENAAGTQVVIRNLGSQNINTSEVNVYINNVLKTCTWSPETISPNSIATCTLAESCSGKGVKASGPANEITRDCV